MPKLRSMALARAISAALLGIVAVSCGSGSRTPPPARDEVVLDQFVTLKDGESNAWRLAPGLYRVEMTASGDGAQVEWIGGDCPKTAEEKTYSGVCELRHDGQIVLSNPTSFGMGSAATVTVKVTKLYTRG